MQGKIKATDQTTDVLELLENIAEDASSELREHIIAIDIDRYKNFLYVMYHYTMDSEQKLRAAASVSHTTELKDYFEHMAKEERGHYILAREDLRELGENVASEVPEAVINFNNHWQELSTDGAFGYLGAVYVFENVAKYLQGEGAEMLAKLDLNKKQSRWVAVHLEADLEHGEEIRQMCEKYIPEDKDKIINGAKIMHKCWLEVFKTAFSNAALHA